MKSDPKLVSKLFFSLIPIQILLVAVGSINTLIDGAMAGSSIGPLAVAAIGLFSPGLKIIDTVNGVLLGGSQILCGQFLGRNQLERTRGVFSLDMTLLSALSLLLTAVGLLIPDALASLLGASPEAHQPLADYITGMAWGIVPMFMTAQLTAFLQLELQQKRTYISMAAMAVVNVGLDVLFIRVLHMGVFGLGLATSLSYWAAFLVQVSYYCTGKASVTFRWSDISPRDLPEIIRIGFPGAVVLFCLAVRGILMNMLLLRFSGNDGVSAMGAFNTCGGLLYSVTAGLGFATRLLASVYVGEEDRESLVTVMRTALTKGIALVCAAAALVCVLSRPIASIFFHDPTSEVFRLTRAMFLIYPLCMPLSAVNTIMVSFFQSSSRMTIVHVLSVLDGIVGTVLSTLLLAPFLGAIGAWIAHVLNGVYTLIAAVVYARLKLGRMPRSIADLLAIPDSFGVPEDRRLDITIHNAAEVTETSGLVMDFCARMGIDRRQGVYAGLCLEEMAANIVKHGFSDGRSHTADVRVVCRDDGLLLRIKDDCRAFDPKEKLALIDPEDVTHNIGLRMTQKLAKEMSYSNMLGLNVLTMVL